MKDEKGKVKLHEAVSLTAARGVRGGFWGALIRSLFLKSDKVLDELARTGGTIL